MAARSSGGQPGNDNATRSLPWRAALDRALAQDDGKKLRRAAEQLLDLAAAGEAWAVKELGDRLDGKPAQQLTVAGDAASPLTIALVSYAANREPDPPT